MATAPANQASGGISEQEAVEAALATLVRRTRLVALARIASRYVIGASIVSIAALVVWRIAAPVFPIGVVVAALYALAIAASAFAWLRTSVSPLAVARYADERLGLKQRLSSALALGHEPPALNPTFLRLQAADAALAAGMLKPEETVPLRGVRRLALGALLSVAVVACLLFFVDRSMPVMVQGLPDAVLAQEGAELGRTAQRIARTAAVQNMPQTRAYAKQLSRLANQMQAREVTRAQALNRLASLSAAARSEQQALAKAAATGGAQSAAEEGAAPGRSNSAGNGASSSPKAKAQAVSGAANISRSLNDAAGQLGRHRLSPAEQRQMAQDLQNLAREASQAGMSGTSRDLRAAAQALAQGRENQAGADLKRAAADARREEQAAQRSAAGAQSATGANGAQRSQGNRQSSGDSNPAKTGATAQAANSSQAGQTTSSHGAAASRDAQGLQSVERSLQQAEQNLSRPQGGAGSQPSSKQSFGGGRAQQPGNEMQQAGAGESSPTVQSAGQPEGSGGGPSNITQGNGRGAPTSPQRYSPAKISGIGYGTPKGNSGIFRGKPQQIDGYKPQASSRYARIYLPGSGPGRTTSEKSGNMGAGSGSGRQASSVPYYQVYPQFKKGAEAAIAKEDIPRAYANTVRQYFQSLAPPAVKQK